MSTSTERGGFWTKRRVPESNMSCTCRSSEFSSPVFRYSQVKAAAENLVRESPIPSSIAPAPAFYWLLDRLLTRMAKRKIWPLPSNLAMQPCDSADFAEYVVECAATGPDGDRPDFGGPQTLTLTELARQYLAARGISRRVVGLRLPGFALRAAGPQTCPDGRHGRTTWAEWLDTEGKLEPAP
jgi:uncharacterized protein YbjT (DUF2867 family)